MMAAAEEDDGDEEAGQGACALRFFERKRPDVMMILPCDADMREFWILVTILKRCTAPLN